MADQYDVEAKLDLNTITGRQSMEALAKQVRDFQKQLAGLGAASSGAFTSAKPAAQTFLGRLQQGTTAASGLGSMLRSALGFAAAYAGFNAISGAMSNLARSSFAFQSSMDKTKISIQAILAATPQFAAMGNPMAAAGKQADTIFTQLQDDALKSVATSQEMFSIYGQILGPLSGAGASLAEIRKITNDTVASAAVLGVDFAQAARDINLMATGAAGQDTMLFRMLKSTGRIKENAEEWNKMMQQTPDKGLKRIQEALDGYAAAAAQFEKSLPGISSSFVDYMQRFRAAFMGGTLEGLRGLLNRMVALFTKHKETITAVLTTLGNAFARFLKPAFSAIERISAYMIKNWDVIADRIENSLMRLQTIVKHYGGTLKVVGAAAVASKVAPGLVGAAAGAAAAPVTAGAAAAGTAIAETASVVIAMGGLSLVLGAVAIAIGVVVGVIGIMKDHWQLFAAVIGIVIAYVQDVITVLWGLLTAFWGVFYPIAKIIMGVVAALGILIGTIVFGLLRAVTWFVKLIMEGWTLIFEQLAPMFEWLYKIVSSLLEFVLGVFAVVNKDLLPKSSTSGGSSFMSGFMDAVMAILRPGGGEEKLYSGEYSNMGNLEKGSPTARSTTINDFRGSRIEVKQDFRNADPDRVWLQMVDGVNAAAERRLTSALVPDFTR